MTNKTISHFMDIVMNSEYSSNNVANKWDINKSIKVKTVGNFNQESKTELNKIITELLELTGLTISIDKSDNADIIVYIGNYTEYANLYDNNIKIENNVKGFFTYSINNNNYIDKATIYIDETLPKHELYDVMKEEFTQIFGFSNDSNDMKDSIFYQYKYKNTNLYNGKYNNLDKDIIKLLYNNDIKTGSSTSDMEEYFNIPPSQRQSGSSNIRSNKGFLAIITIVIMIIIAIFLKWF